MPDQLTDPIRIITRNGDGKTVENFARLSQVRTGEYAHDIPSARRYEISDVASEHPGDMVERRFIVDEQHTTTTPGGGQLPAWSLKSTTLHPDRHDIAAWFEQANSEPTPVWAAHMPIIVRDALRGRSPPAKDETAVVVLPDRAALIASRDNEKNPLSSVIDTFSAQVHTINRESHRNGQTLAPISFANGGTDTSYAAVVTRAQAVIAEAIVSSHEACPIPTPDAFAARWNEVVQAELADTMKREDDTTFSSPIAIVDDHRAKNRATIILATLRIKLGLVRPDIWLSYHTVYDLVIGRGGSVNYESDLRADEGPRQQDKDDVLMALNDGKLPILNLSADRAGNFDFRDFEKDVPGTIPLLRKHPTFTLNQAALALMLFRQPDAHKEGGNVSWRDVFGREKPDGETNKNGAKTDKMVAEQTPPSEPDHIAPETAQEDGTDENVLRKDDGNETDEVDAAATEADAADGDTSNGSVSSKGNGHDAGDDNDGDIPDVTTTDTKTDTTTTTSGDAFAGAGEAALRREAYQIGGDDIGVWIAGQLNGDDGETNRNGAGTDKMVAEQTPPSEPDHIAPETAQEDGTDENVLRKDDGVETDEVDAANIARSDGLYVSTLKEIADTLTDTDQKIVDMIREAVAEKRRNYRHMREVPSKADVLANQGVYNKLVFRLASKQLTSPRKRTVKTLALAKQLWDHPDRWPRFLLVLNILPELDAKDANTSKGVSSAEDVAAAARATVQHAKLVKELDLRLDLMALQGSSPSASGGPNG